MQHIKQAGDNILKIAQDEDEDEDDYFIWFEEANLRAGSSLDARRKLTLLINGFDSAIRPYLSRFFQSEPMETKLDVLEESKVEGKTNRARNKGRKKRSSSVNFMSRHEEDSSSEEDAYGVSCPESKSFDAMTRGEPSSGELTADFHEESAQVFAATGSGYTPAKSYRNTGWKNPPTRRATGKFTRLTDVCERCYERGIGKQLPHGVTNCTATLTRDKDAIIENFNRLASWEIGKVQINLILRSTGCLSDHTNGQKGWLPALLSIFSASSRSMPKPLASTEQSQTQYALLGPPSFATNSSSESPSYEMQHICQFMDSLSNMEATLFHGPLVRQKRSFHRIACQNM